jgi:hypothetical protein
MSETKSFQKSLQKSEREATTTPLENHSQATYSYVIGNKQLSLRKMQRISKKIKRYFIKMIPRRSMIEINEPTLPEAQTQEFCFSTK